MQAQNLNYLKSNKEVIWFNEGGSGRTNLDDVVEKKSIFNKISNGFNK
jgi:hypothetical protein